MKPIDGIDLSALIQREQDEHYREREEEVLKTIRGIMTNARSLSFQIDRKQKELEKLIAAKIKVDARIAQIEAGNWAVLGEDKEPDSGHKDAPTDLCP